MNVGVGEPRREKKRGLKIMTFRVLAGLGDGKLTDWYSQWAAKGSGEPIQHDRHLVTG